VFVCGHSFHVFIAAPLAGMARAGGFKDHTLVGSQFLGGSRTLQHWNLLDAKNKAKQALQTGAVDVLTLSPIQHPDEGVDQFVALALKHNPAIRVTVQESWAAWDSDLTFPKGARAKVGVGCGHLTLGSPSCWPRLLQRLARRARHPM
jgi:hypothetical protein